MFKDSLLNKLNRAISIMAQSRVTKGEREFVRYLLEELKTEVGQLDLDL